MALRNASRASYILDKYFTTISQLAAVISNKTSNNMRILIPHQAVSITWSPLTFPMILISFGIPVFLPHLSLSPSPLSPFPFPLQIYNLQVKEYCLLCLC